MASSLVSRVFSPRRPCWWTGRGFEMPPGQVPSSPASGWQKKTNSLLYSTYLQARFTYKPRYLHVVPVTTLSCDYHPLTHLASALPWNPRTY